MFGGPEALARHTESDRKKVEFALQQIQFAIANPMLDGGNGITYIVVNGSRF